MQLKMLFYRSCVSSEEEEGRVYKYRITENLFITLSHMRVQLIKLSMRKDE